MDANAVSTFCLRFDVRRHAALVSGRGRSIVPEQPAAILVWIRMGVGVREGNGCPQSHFLEQKLKCVCGSAKAISEKLPSEATRTLRHTVGTLSCVSHSYWHDS